MRHSGIKFLSENLSLMFVMVCVCTCVCMCVSQQTIHIYCLFGWLVGLSSVSVRSLLPVMWLQGHEAHCWKIHTALLLYSCPGAGGYSFTISVRPEGEGYIQPLDMVTRSLLWQLLDHRLKFWASKSLVLLPPQFSRRPLAPPASIPTASAVLHHVSSALELLTIPEYGTHSPASVLLPLLFLLLGVPFPLFSGQQPPIYSANPNKMSSPLETICPLPLSPWGFNHTWPPAPP